MSAIVATILVGVIPAVSEAEGCDAFWARRHGVSVVNYTVLPGLIFTGRLLHLLLFFIYYIIIIIIY
jgi:hypothetical protein